MQAAGHSYRLCSYCVRRQGGSGPFEAADRGGCCICGGLMDKVQKAAEGAARRIRRHQFQTFTVGVKLPEGVQEKEDELRSDLRLKGNETIKTQTARLIAAHVSAVLRKEVDRFAPDLTLLVEPATGDVEVSSRPAFYYGRYTKPRGVAQKREPCQSCNGVGCGRCRGTGYGRAQSVEGLLRKKLLGFSGSDRATFTWLGSEDRTSAVFPPGRPFLAEVKNPVKRVIPRRFAARCKGGLVSVSGGRVLPGKPVKLPAFRFRSEIQATAAGKISRDDVAALARAFRRREVRFERPYARTTSKMVYSARATASGRSLTILAELDGGLPVKRFVSGELVSPSVSEVLKTEVRCRRFDICGVTETGKLEIGEVTRIQKKNQVPP